MRLPDSGYSLVAVVGKIKVTKHACLTLSPAATVWRRRREFDGPNVCSLWPIYFVMLEIAPFLLDGHDVDDTSDCTVVGPGWPFGDIERDVMRFELAPT